MVGNPPFQSEFIDRLLERAHEWLPAGGRAGFILPAYYFQSARRTVRHLERWSIAQEMIPRSIFLRFKSPLVFALFTKDRRKTMIGFALYTEAASAEQIDRRFCRIIEQGGRSIWKQVVELVLDLLGGEANLQQIYALIEPRRPTPNPFWRKKIRQIYQLHFVRTGPGRYAMA